MAVQQPGPVTSAMIALGRSLIELGINRATAPERPNFQTQIRPPAHPAETPAPSPANRYQPLDGCPWCGVAADLNATKGLIERSISHPTYASEAYIPRARQILGNVLSRIMVTKGEIMSLSYPISEITQRLMNPQVDLAAVVADLSHLVDLAYDAAERPIVPTDPSVVAFRTMQLGPTATATPLHTQTTNGAASGDRDITDQSIAASGPGPIPVRAE